MYRFSFLKSLSYTVLRPPFSKGGERGEFCRPLGQKGDEEKNIGLFYKKPTGYRTLKVTGRGCK